MAQRKPPTLADALTTPEAEQYTRRTRRTLHRWHAEGRINKYSIGGRLLWSRRELDALVKPWESAS